MFSSLAEHNSVRTIAPSTLSVGELTALKSRLGLRISVCLPARNEEETVGAIVSSVVDNLMCVASEGLVDELIVLDDGSTDRTAEVAADAGAEVRTVSEIWPEVGEGSGKGNVLWLSLFASTGDIIVWCDTDLTSFTPDYITGLVAPLVNEPSVGFVKGFYERPLGQSGQGGGRTTELVARPLLSMFFPPLATIRQPLGGEVAGRRSLLERLPFVESYGVESAMLIDIFQKCGTNCMAQVDLGVRRHRNRSLASLSEQASEILAVVLARAGVALPSPLPPLITQNQTPREIPIAERPPMISLAGYSTPPPPNRVGE